MRTIPRPRCIERSAVSASGGDSSAQRRPGNVSTATSALRRAQSQHHHCEPTWVCARESGALHQAEPLLRAQWNVQDLLGTGHPQTLTSMNNLALLHESQGQFDRAEPSTCCRSKYSPPRSARRIRDDRVINNLAYLYMLEDSSPSARFLRAPRGLRRGGRPRAPGHAQVAQQPRPRAASLGELDAAEATISGRSKRVACSVRAHRHPAFHARSRRRLSRSGPPGEAESCSAKR